MVATEPVHDPQGEVPQPPGLLLQRDDEDVIDDVSELRELVKQLRLELKTNKELVSDLLDASKEDADKEDKHEKETKVPNMSNTYDDHGIQQSLRNFDAKSVCKPVPWNGEDEAEFKMWKERLATYMSSAGDKAWRSIFKFINDMDENEDLDDATKVNTMLIELKISMDLRPDLQDMLYDQLNQYTKGDLLSDIQMNGISQVFESYRKAAVYGKKKTAENVHRARNRVARPEVAGSLSSLETKYRKWKKDLAYLKDIGADDFTETTLVSILVDFLPDEVNKEVNMKVETVGKNSVSLKTLQALIEKIMTREKDRTESRRDRQGRPAHSLEEQERTCPQEQHPEKPEEKPEDLGYYWDDCWGGYIAMAVKRGPDGADEPEAKRTRPEDQEKGKGKSKGKGKGKGKCHICSDEGRYMAQCPQRWYVPKTVFGSWWNALPFHNGKSTGKG